MLDDGKIFWSGCWYGLNKVSNGFSEEIKIEDVVSFSCGYDHCLFLESKNKILLLIFNNFLEL